MTQERQPVAKLERRRRIERDLERMRALLQSYIRRRGFTYEKVQEALGWGRSYISQLLTAQKSMRVEQVIMILNVIGVPPEEFFDDVYQLGTRAPRPRSAAPAVVPNEPIDAGELAAIRTLLESIARLLIESSVFTAADLERAVARYRQPDA